MAAFVNDDEVETRADSDARPVTLEITVLEVIAVSDGGLVFHAGVWHLDQLVAVFYERIVAKVVLKGLQHSFCLSELFSGLAPDLLAVHKNRAAARPADLKSVVGADVQRYVVVVDWIMDEPFPARVAVAQIRFADELSV